MFGVYGDVMYRWSKGIDDSRVRSSEDPQKSISRETTLYQDTLSRPLLRALLYYLSERVAAELREMDRSARCVTLKLRYADFDTITRSRTLKDPTDSHQNIFQMGQELMERNLGEKGKLVRLIGIGVSNLVGEGRQLGLMSPYSRKQMLLNRTLDRIRERYGFSAIQTGITLALRERYPTEAEGYALKTSALSR
ncbi:MAG: dinB [Dehalococcoidia bacterium]|nr:dinB [Dehalococcoidia bacterium]